MDDETPQDRRDTAAALLRLHSLLERGDEETGGSTAPRRRAPRLANAGAPEPGAVPGYEIGQMPADSRSPWDPATWDGTDGAVQALLDGEKERRRPKVKRTAGYYAVIGHAPECKAGEIGEARVYLAKIMKALELGGWSHSEYTGLKKLEKTWRERATGRDVRFMLVGNYRGRLLREDENRIRALRLAQRRGQL